MWQPDLFFDYFHFTVYEEVVRGEDKYCVTVFYTTGGGALQISYALCFYCVLCINHVRLLHWNINREPGLVYALCRVTFPCRQVTTHAVRALSLLPEP